MDIPNLIFIVPYRDRKEHYNIFSDHMKNILENEKNYKILYIHQTDNRSFNRGAMKNIGFLVVKDMYPNDYKNITLVFNDIDTMPSEKGLLDYHTEKGRVKHFYGFIYALGGIVSINAGDFEKVNGFPNYWGWGYEDNSLNDRVIANKIIINRKNFYHILDKKITHLGDGLVKKVNKTDYQIFKKKINEGISTIKDLKYKKNVDGFIDILEFNTGREENISTRKDHNILNGNVPFKGMKSMMMHFT